MQVVDIADRRIVRGTDRFGTAPGAVAPQSRPAYKDWARGDFPMSGKWYVEVDCARCGEPISLGEVPSPEEEPEVKFRTVTDVPCPACGYTDTYAPELMSRRPAS